MGWDQSIIAPLCCSLFLQLGVLSGLQSFRKNTCSHVDSPGPASSVRKTFPSMFFSTGCRGIPAQRTAVLPPLCLPSPWGWQGWFSHFPPHSSLPVSCFCRSSTHCPRGAAASAVGSAMSSGGCVGASGAGRVWHRTARGSLQLLLLPSWGTCIPHGFSPALCSQPS